MDLTPTTTNGYGCDDNISNDESLELEDLEFNQNLDTSSIDGTLDLLYNENRLLKENLTKSNASMKLALEQIAASKEFYDKQQLESDEKCSQAKKIIAALREEILQKDCLIGALREQGSTNESGILEFESLRSQLSEMKNSAQLAIQERDDIKNKYISLEMQYRSLIDSSELQKRQDEQTVETMRKTITTLKLIQAKDDKEKRELSGSLNHLRLQFDDLISEYEKLILDEKNRKAVILTKENEMKQLQIKAQKLETGLEQQQSMAEYYQSHFEAERQARQELHNQCITLKANLNRLMSMREKQINPSGPSSLNARPRRDVCVCPKCGHEAPNIEALQRHCHSCGD